jgi:uncharacterized damage-inducible protein DinB
MLSLSLGELMAFTEEERERWRTWLDANPRALGIRMQPDGRFATVGALIDHIFLVEARHLARLQRQAVPNESGIPTEIAPLFAYGRDVRQGLLAYIDGLSDADAATIREVTVQSGTASLTPRKLLLHIGLHETRHWAQIALAVRLAGLAPPGNHDLFYSRALV